MCDYTQHKVIYWLRGIRHSLYLRFLDTCIYIHFCVLYLAAMLLLYICRSDWVQCPHTSGNTMPYFPLAPVGALRSSSRLPKTGAMAFTVVLEGGSPWGFRLQGGREFNEPLRIAKVGCQDCSVMFKCAIMSRLDAIFAPCINSSPRPNAPCVYWYTHKSQARALSFMLCVHVQLYAYLAWYLYGGYIQ